MLNVAFNSPLHLLVQLQNFSHVCNVQAFHFQAEPCTAYTITALSTEKSSPSVK